MPYTAVINYFSIWPHIPSIFFCTILVGQDQWGDNEIYPYDEPLLCAVSEMTNLRKLLISNGDDQESRKYLFRYCISR